MGAMYGIDIYHKGYLGNSNYYSTYDSFSLKQLEMILEKAIEGTNYHIIKIKRQRLLFQCVTDVEVKNDEMKQTEQFIIKKDLNKNAIIIKALFLTDKLYSLIIKLAPLYKIQIHFDGIIPVYTPETIHQYKNRNYWFIYNVNPNEIAINAMQIATDFLNYDQYWDLHVFIENYGYLNFNNHTDQPLDGYYNIIIKESSENENSYHNVTLKESKKFIKRFGDALNKKDQHEVSVLFQPVHKSYTDINIEIEGEHDIESLIQTYFEINANALQKEIKCCSIERISDKNIKVYEFSKKEENSSDEIEINEEGLQNGLIYTDKMCNDHMFEFLCTQIASNFCPCSPGGKFNIGEKIIYYKDEKDKEVLQKSYRSYVTNLIFKKV